MNYHVMYTDGGTMKVRSFQSSNKRLEWVGQFTLENLGHDDFSVDLVFNGDVEHIHPYIEVDNEEVL